jgi:hypothetical protein
MLEKNLLKKRESYILTGHRDNDRQKGHDEQLQDKLRHLIQYTISMREKLCLKTNTYFKMNSDLRKEYS